MTLGHSQTDNNASKKEVGDICATTPRLQSSLHTIANRSKQPEITETTPGTVKLLMLVLAHGLFYVAIHIVTMQHKGTSAVDH